MRVTMRTQYAGPRGNAAPDTAIDLPEAEARELIAGGYAAPETAAVRPPEATTDPVVQETGSLGPTEATVTKRPARRGR
jgi:hypothetical protein